MHVVRRAIKQKVAESERLKYSKLLDISESLDWYEANVGISHPLYPVLGELRTFYRVVRNVSSHPQDLEWDYENNQVILHDKISPIEVDVDEYMQRYRYLVYLCEFGLRGILSAFCERERGEESVRMIREYSKIFPESFPVEEVIIRPYS